jgi:hypothetical protein
MKKKKVNTMKFLKGWREFLSNFNEKGFHTDVFPEDILRSSSEDKIVFYSPMSNIVFGTIFKDIPLVVILLIHPNKPSVDLVHFANEKAIAFLGTDDSVSYPKGAPPVTDEIISTRTKEVLSMAFPEEVVNTLTAEQ